MEAYFPVVLSPSPVHEAFEEIRADALERLSLSESERFLILTAEANVLDYTLQQPSEAEAYARVLLKALDHVICSPTYAESTVRRLPLDAALPAGEAAARLQGPEAPGVLAHYLTQRLSEAVLHLRTPDTARGRRATLASVFFPDGILLPEAAPALRRALLAATDGAAAAVTEDVFLQRGAALCLGCLLMDGRRLQGEHRLLSPLEPLRELLVAWLAAQLQAPLTVGPALAVLTPALTTIIVDPPTRDRFAATGGVALLVRNLQPRRQVPVQQRYELAYCLWVLSFDVLDDEALRRHFHRDGVVTALADLVVAAPREKVVRLGIAALCNLANCRGDGDARPIRVMTTSSIRKSIDGRTFLNEMIGCGLAKALDHLKHKALNDEDFVKDLDHLDRLLQSAAHDMTRWDVYVAEVNSGHLQWGMLHSEKFFKENAKLMEGENGDFYLVKRLIQLAASDDEDVAAIACYDIGEFARFYPSGRAVVKRLGVRNVVMHLMDSPSDELRRHAVLCTSKVLVHNWQHVSS